MDRADSCVKYVRSHDAARYALLHHIAKVLDQLPKRLQSKAKKILHETTNADTRKDAEEEIQALGKIFDAKHPDAVESLDELLHRFDFPTEH